PAETTGGLVGVRLAAGRHTLANARPSPAVLGKTVDRLASLMAEGQAQRQRWTASTAAPAAPAASALTTAWAGKAGGSVVDLVTISSEQGPLVCAAAGNAVHLMAPDGREVRTLATEGAVRCLRWWPEHDLLLVGCQDEKVIAFDREGRRRWVFVSE